MAVYRRCIIILLLSLSSHLLAQENRYVVFFADKANSTFSIEEPLEYLSQRAIDRRNSQNLDITEEDLPVIQSYLQELKDIDVEVFYTSRWMNAALVQTADNKISEIEGLEFVTSVEFVAPDTKLQHGARKQSENEEEEIAAENSTQLNMLGIPTLKDTGASASDYYIAFFDGGFRGVDTISAFQHIFNEDRLIFNYNLVENNSDVFQHSNHGTRVFSTVAAYEPEVYEGVAPDATFMLFITEDVDDEYRIEEYNWLIAAEKADSAGVDIINASLGYNTFDDPAMDYTHADLDGNTSVVTRAASLAAERGILVVVSAGNEGNNGWQRIVPPADSPDILAVGSVNSSGLRSEFSSMGPTADGRIKPDVVALGGGTVMIADNGNITSANGTSFASPLIAGMAALLWDQNPVLNNFELIDFIKGLGSNSPDPDNFLGHGTPSYNAILGIDKSVMNYLVYPNPSTNGQIAIRTRDGRGGDVTFYNGSGQVVLETKFASEQLINIAHFKAGIYYLEVITDKKPERIQIVKF